MMVGRFRKAGHSDLVGFDVSSDFDILPGSPLPTTLPAETRRESTFSSGNVAGRGARDAL
jgi:hypothetical protein